MVFSKNTKKLFSKESLEKLEEELEEEEEIIEKEDMFVDACKTDTQFLLNKLLDTLVVYQSLTLTFNKNELDKILECLNTNSYTASQLDFTLSVNKDYCLIKFTRR